MKPASTSDRDDRGRGSRPDRETIRGRGHPAGILYTLVFIGVVLMCWFEWWDFFRTKEPAWRDVIGPVLSLCMIGPMGYLWGSAMMLRWEIELDGEVVILRRNRKELYRGRVGDLERIEYDAGVLCLKAPDGRTFAFPARGPMKRFIRNGADAAGRDRVP